MRFLTSTMVWSGILTRFADSILVRSTTTLCQYSIRDGKVTICRTTINDIHAIGRWAQYVTHGWTSFKRGFQTSNINSSLIGCFPARTGKYIGVVAVALDGVGPWEWWEWWKSWEWWEWWESSQRGKQKSVTGELKRKYMYIVNNNEQRQTPTTDTMRIQVPQCRHLMNIAMT